jgi:hypothetical protein
MDTPLRIATVDVPSCGTRPATMEHLWSQAGATGGKRSLIGALRKMIRRGSTVRVRQRA